MTMTQTNTNGMSDQQDQAKTKPVPLVTFHGIHQGYPVTIQIPLDLSRIHLVPDRLKECKIAPAPTEWQRTPEGEPICPVHNVVMQRREKQGDVWHSHKVTGKNGKECYCRGYPHGDESDDGYYQ